MWRVKFVTRPDENRVGRVKGRDGLQIGPVLVVECMWVESPTTTIVRRRAVVDCCRSSDSHESIPFIYCIMLLYPHLDFKRQDYEQNNCAEARRIVSLSTVGLSGSVLWQMQRRFQESQTSLPQCISGPVAVPFMARVRAHSKTRFLAFFNEANRRFKSLFCLGGLLFGLY